MTHLKRKSLRSNSSPSRAGLTLVEVTLAIGVFTLAMSILLGLLAPMLSDLSDVIDADETQAIVNKVEVYLETFDQIEDVPAFEEVYDRVLANHFIQVFIYRTIEGRIQIGDEFEDVDRAMRSLDPKNMVDRRVFLALVSPSQSNWRITPRRTASTSGAVRDTRPTS